MEDCCTCMKNELYLNGHMVKIYFTYICMKMRCTWTCNLNEHMVMQIACVLYLYSRMVINILKLPQHMSDSCSHATPQRLGDAWRRMEGNLSSFGMRAPRGMSQFLKTSELSFQIPSQKSLREQRRGWSGCILMAIAALDIARAKIRLPAHFLRHCSPVGNA